MDRPLPEHAKRLMKGFRPQGYVELMSPVFDKNDFLLQHLHRVFSSGKYKGDRCLDFGCGPTIYNVASASKYFNSIVSADFLEQNRLAVEKWLKKDPTAVDWSPVLEIIAKMEGFSDVKAGAESLAERIRSRIKSVVYCDALAKRALPDDVKGDFDMVISSLCLEAAPSNNDEFKIAVKNIAELLKPGGVFLFMSSLGCTYWIVSNTRFHAIPLTRPLVEEALKEANFQDIDWHEMSINQPQFDATAFFFLSCIKKP